jgi:hypothetical protein
MVLLSTKSSTISSSVTSVSAILAGAELDELELSPTTLTALDAVVVIYDR